MNRSGFVAGAVAALLLGSVAFAQRPAPAGDPPPDVDTLRRMAAALGAKPGPGGLDPQLLDAVKKLIGDNPGLIDTDKIDPATAEQYKKLAQQNPAMMKQLKERFEQNPDALKKQLGQSGPKLTPEQIEQFSKMFKNGGPDFDPGAIPTLPGQPRQPPMPGGGPDDPRPFDPAGKPPIPGGNPGDPPPFDPTKPQHADTIPPQQAAANPLQNGQPTIPNEPPEEVAKKSGEFTGLVQAWEQNVGPLDDTPALKQSLIDMFAGGGGLDGLTGPDGKPWFDGSGMTGPGGTGPGGTGPGGSSPGGGAWNWLKGLGGSSGGGSNWWDGLKPNGNSSNNWAPKGGGSNWTPPKGPNWSNGGGGGGGGGGLGDLNGAGTIALVVLGIVVAAVIAFLVYRYWPAITGKGKAPKPLPGLGEWPVDPRHVTDRATLIRAFEYVSVLVCGDGARVWNHLTIAEALKAALPACEPFAAPLARLYALARYTPASDDITPADIAEARRYLCRLAEVPAA